MQQKYNTVIVGAGASGIFAAINIKNPSESQILIIEKTNKALSKVKVSGGGRCNVTHACFDPKELVNFYPRGNKELLGPFHQFQPGDVIEWFSNRNVELKIEEDGRMFPTTDNSQTIIDCFFKEIERNKIKIHYKSDLTKITPTENGFTLTINNQQIECKKLLIASGGFKNTEQAKLITNLGHQIKDPAPSLFTFNLPNHPITKLQGIVCDAVIKITGTNYLSDGSLLITHWGMSGPAILKLSSWAARYLQENNYSFNYEINWLPNHSTETLIEMFNQIKSEFGNKKIINHLPIEIPKKILIYLLEKARIDKDKKWAEINKKEIVALAELITKDIYQAQGKTTFKQEFVTCGGIKLNEVNFKTMESKIIPNLYFSGEVLNIDALTGGFNFQAAWTTAWIAAKNLN